MKKFTFMLLAAFIAVSSWAQPVAVQNHKVLPEQFAAKTATTLKQAPQMKKEMAPRQALKAKVQAPAQKTNMKKAKAAPKKAIDVTAILSGEPVTFMVKSYAYDVENVGTDEEPDYQLVPVSIPRVTESWTMTFDATTMTASITGINGGETAVTGTVDAESMTITIPYGQATGTSDYGTLGLASATGAENLVCILTEDAVVFGDYWYIVLTDGDYAGEMWSYIYESVAVIPNGKMTWGTDEVDVDIDVDTENYVATVWNFAGNEVAVDVTLKPEGKFVIEPQIIQESFTWQGSPTGDFYVYNSDCEKPISGTGTENTLIFGSTWTMYAPDSGVWYGEQAAATITFDGTFVYPELTEAPATPADPEVTFFDFWNGESATVIVNVPCVDVDGNDIMSSLLSYQLFTQNEKGELVELGKPYAYDDKDNGTGDEKTVVLGEEAKNLTVIGVKSIYTAAGETNESNIVWFEIPQLVELPAGVEAREYPVTSSGYYSSGWQDYKATVLVGVDGTDVYVQGILPHCPNGWAKGTLADGIVTFPVQCVGTLNGSVYIYLAAYGFDSGVPDPVTFTTNASMEMFVSEDYILANSHTDKFGFYYPYFAGMTIGEETIPELVELPEGAEVVEYPFTGTTYSGDGSTEFESTVNVAVVGNDVYVQGLNSYVPEAWVKGTKDEETGNIIFPTGQNLGTFEYNGTTYQFFMVGYDAATETITDVVMTYNEEEDYYKLQNDLLLNGKKSTLYYYTWYEAGSTIGIQTTFTATFDFNTMDVATSMGSGDDYVPDGDIKETRELTNSKVTLAISPKTESASNPNRFWQTTAGPQLRMYSNTLTFTVPRGYFITGIQFYHNGYWGGKNNGGKVSVEPGTITNDATNKVATWAPEEGVEGAEVVVVTIGANTQLNKIAVTVVKAPEVAATPATPAFDGLLLIGTQYPKLYLDIPTVDVDEYPLNKDKLYYTVWYELAGGKAQQFTVSADAYESLEEDMVEVPYTYSDGWDIYEGGSPIYLNPADIDYTAWKRIGVQSIYYGADERRESEITWITPVSVSNALYATFVAPVDVDFTENSVSAFAVTVNGEYAHLEPVTTVPAGTAVVVKAESVGTYIVNETTEATLGTDNELVVATEDVTADGTQYVLAKPEGEDVGFYQVNAGSTIAAGKGYLVVSSPVKGFYGFGPDDATGIENLNINANLNGAIYNVAGQRLNKMQKGINIVNGKKILK